MSCRCAEPRERTDPRSSGTCSKCGKVIGSGVLSTDETVKWFFDRLQEGSFPGKVPEDFLVFRRQCEERERAGRQQFGLSYLARDNIGESLEEAADLAIYMHLCVLRALRESGGQEDPDISLAFTAAHHAFRAHEAARRLAGKRRGAP